MEQDIASADLLGKLRIGISRGLRIVNVRSKEAYDVMKIRNEIGGKEKYKRKLIQELGQSVYRLYKHKETLNEESIKSKCNQLADLENEIEELNGRINLVHENALKELGKLKALSKPDSRFKCQKCGVENEQNATVCSACGSEL